MTRAPSLSARLGAISYVVWAVLHFMAAVSVYKLGLHAGANMVGGRLLQDAFNLAAFSAFGTGVAICLNWRNSAWGYWINLSIISVADIGFVIFVLVPGYMPLWPGLAGPIFWITGAVLTTVGQLARPKTTT